MILASRYESQIHFPAYLGRGVAQPGSALRSSRPTHYFKSITHNLRNVRLLRKRDCVGPHTSFTVASIHDEAYHDHR